MYVHVTNTPAGGVPDVAVILLDVPFSCSVSLTQAGDALFVQSLSTSLWRINIAGDVNNLTLNGSWSCLYYTCAAPSTRIHAGSPHPAARTRFPSSLCACCALCVLSVCSLCVLKQLPAA
jgi:hypothetical protein